MSRHISDNSAVPGASKNPNRMTICEVNENNITNIKKFTLEDFIAQTKMINKNVDPDRFKKSSDIFPNFEI